jgi:16S rRNA processing protein RimM
MSNSRSSQPTDRVAVARISGAHGLRGGLRLEWLTDWPEELAPGSEVWIEGQDTPRRVLALLTGGRTPLLELEAVDSREAAEALVGTFLEVPARKLPPETYWWHEIEGLEVVAEDGTPIGTVAEVFRAGANEVYRVVGPDGERLIPALKQAVVSIDPAAGRMVVREERTYVAEG